MVKRFDVYMCENHGKIRPCVVLSPDEMNDALPYVIVAPITSHERPFPTRVGIRIKGKQGQIALDLIRPAAQILLKEKIGTLPNGTCSDVSDILKNLFSI